MILALVIAALGTYSKCCWGFWVSPALMTDALSLCPLYEKIGVNTCTHKSVQ